MKKRIVLTVFAVLLIMFYAAPWPAPAQPDLASIESLVEGEMRRWEMPGAAVAIVDGGETVMAKGFGVKRIGGDAAVDERTQFGIASNSKAFTCAALAMLVDEGIIDWNDRVVDILPGFKLADEHRARELTVLDLVAHRTGVESADRMWWRSQFTRPDMLQRFQYLKPVEPVRMGYRYNNLMYLLAGMVLEERSGQSWNAFVENRILKPLGMTDTTTTIGGLLPDGNYAAPHAPNGEGVMVPTGWYNSDHVGPAASINSCARDMAVWMAFLMGGGSANGVRILSATRMEEMRSPHNWMDAGAMRRNQRPVNFYAYGLGLRLYDYQGLKFVEHGGHLVTFRSTVCMVPERGFGVTVLTSTETDLCDALAHTIADRILDLEPKNWTDIEYEKHREWLDERRNGMEKRDSARVPNAPASLPHDAYAGAYENPLYGRVDVIFDNGRLLHRFNNAPLFRGELRHWHYDTFLLDPMLEFRDETLAAFHLNADGKAASVVINGETYTKTTQGGGE